jgi:glutamate racemase
MTRLGFLDSGIGGLTVLNAFVEKQNACEPNPKNLQEIIYLADLANLPYGGKSLKELRAILHANLVWFANKVDTLVLACNTSSALLDQELEQEFSGLQIIGLIGALQEQLSREYKNLESIAVFSTLATHNSGAYLKAFKTALPGAKRASVACPKLVPIIEDNLSLGLGSEELNALALKALNEYAQNLPFVPQALVYGCSHYPLLSKAFKHVFPNTLLLDPAQAVIMNLQNCLMTDTSFQAYSSGSSGSFAVKLDLLKGILNCANHFRAEVKLAETTARKT